MNGRQSFFITDLGASVSLNHSSMASMFIAAYQGYSYMSTTHTDGKCLIIFIATFEESLTQMMGCSTKAASLSLNGDSVYSFINHYTGMSTS